MQPKKGSSRVQNAANASPGDQPQGNVKKGSITTAPALESSVGYALRRAQLSTYEDFTRVMQPFDIRPSQFAVLMLIQSKPGLTQSAVCTALGIQKTNFVAVLDKLESRGITERRRLGLDRRSSALHLTEAGETFITSLKAAHDKMEKKLAKRLGPKRTRDLLALLNEFAVKSHHS